MRGDQLEAEFAVARVPYIGGLLPRCLATLTAICRLANRA